MRGPSQIDVMGLSNLRYSITDLVDDIKQPRNNNEFIATGSKLLEVHSEFTFRANQKWSGKGKWVSRRLLEIDSELESEFFSPLDRLFTNKDSSGVIELCEKMISPYGGFLFEGHNLDARQNGSFLLMISSIDPRAYFTNSFYSSNSKNLSEERL